MTPVKMEFLLAFKRFPLTLCCVYRTGNGWSLLNGGTDNHKIERSETYTLPNILEKKKVRVGLEFYFNLIAR